MKERPILFSAPMVRAILEGRKTQTRRVMRVDKHPTVVDWVIDSEGRAAARALNSKVLDQYITTFPHGRVLCPYGRAGDRLWVRETFALVGGGDPGIPLYGATWREDAKRWNMQNADKPPKFKPSIHMPRWASRITLEVTDVRVERLQEISEEDARAEGLYQWKNGPNCPIHYGIGLPDVWETDPRRTYERLWGDINGADSWAANPWVWVVEFKRVTP